MAVTNLRHQNRSLQLAGAQHGPLSSSVLACYFHKLFQSRSRRPRTCHSWFLPKRHFENHSKTIAAVWANLLPILPALFQRTSKFSILHVLFQQLLLACRSSAVPSHIRYIHCTQLDSTHAYLEAMIILSILSFGPSFIRSLIILFLALAPHLNNLARIGQQPLSYQFSMRAWTRSSQVLYCCYTRPKLMPASIWIFKTALLILYSSFLLLFARMRISQSAFCFFEIRGWSRCL